MMFWTLSSTLLTSFSQGLTGFAVIWLIQSTALIVLGLAVSRLLARQGSAVQFVVCATTLTAVLVCPAVTWSMTMAGLTQWSIVSPTAIVQPPDPSVPTESSRSEAPELRPSSKAKLAGPSFRRIEVRDRAVENDILAPSEATVAATPIVESQAPASPAPSIATSTESANSSAAAVDTVMPVGQPRSFEPALPIAWIRIALGLIWLSVSGWFLSRLAVAWFHLHRIRHEAFPADRDTLELCDDIAQSIGVASPLILRTPFLPSPCLAGLFRPIVLLPEEDLSGSMRDVLTHELAHLHRRDYQWQLMRVITTSLFWFNPLIWILSHQMEMAAEEVCDDFVVEFGADRTRYAHCLIDVAEFSTASMAVAGVAMVSFQTMLTRRVKRIMDTTRLLSTRASRGMVTSTFALGAVGTLAIALLGAVPTISAESKSHLFAKDAAAGQPGIQLPLGDSTDFSAQTASSDGVPNGEQFAAAPKFTPEQPGKPGFNGPLPGILSSPPTLPGGRRWQMYTKNTTAGVTQLCWSPNGRWLAVASGLFVRLYDFDGGSPEFKVILAGHSDIVKSVRFNAQGDRLATAANDGTVRLWNLEGREQFVYRDHEDAVLEVSWHPDETRLASASLDGTVRIWTTDGKTDAVIRDHEAPVNAVAWNPSGKLLASGCENKTIRYWNEQGQPAVVIDAHIGPVKSLAWNADGTQIISCDFGIESSDETEEDRAHIKVWDIDGKPVSSVLVNKPLSHVAWSPDGKRAIAGSWRSAVLWTIGEKTITNRSSNGITGIAPVAWRPSGEYIAAGPLLLDSAGNPSASLPVRVASANSTSLNADQSVLGVGRTNGGFDLFTRDGEQRFQSTGGGNNAYGMIQSISWSPDGQSFVPAIRYLRQLQRYDAKGMISGASLALPADTRSVTWSRDGKTIAVGGDTMAVAVVDLETGKATQIGRQKHGVTQVRFTPDQQQVCSAGYDSCIRFWSLDGKPMKVLEAIAAPIDGLAWSSDGEVMATGHQDQTIRLWNKDGELQNVVGGHGGYVESVEFNPQGTLLASGSRDNTVRIWKRDGTPVVTLRGHLGPVFGVGWTADGTRVYSSSHDGTVRLWNVETGLAEWQILLGDKGGYVTVDAQGAVKYGDEKLLESDFVFFAEDNERRLTRTTLAEIRSAMNSAGQPTAN